MRKFFGLFFLIILIAIFIYLYQNKLSAFYNNTGVDLYEKGSYEEAILYFKKSLAIFPNNNVTYLNLANAYKELAKIYLQQKMYPDATTQLKSALALNPADNEIKELLARVSLNEASDYSSKAVDEFLSGNKKYAYELLNKAVTLKTDYAYPHYLLGFFYYAGHKFNAAITELEKVIAVDPQFPLVNKLLGDIYIDNGNYYPAIEQYKLALSLNFNDYISCNNIAIALTQIERYQEALAYIKKASELAPLNPNILYTLASIYRDNNMLKHALSVYEKLSNYPNVHNDKAGIYTTQGRIKEASLEYNKQIEYCNRKLSVNPYDALNLENLAKAYIGIEDYAKAEMVIHKAISIAPDYKQIYIILADIQKKLGRYNEASTTLEKVSRLPNSPKLKIIKSDISKIKDLAVPVIENKALVYLDKIYLKNGRIIEGIIKSETAGKVVLEVKIGNSTGDMILYNNTIARVLKTKKIE